MLKVEKQKIMRTQIFSKDSLHKFGSYLFNLGMVTGLATLTFGLISCGGGGGGGATRVTGGSTMTISSITAIPAASGVTGIIAASAAQPLTIYGTNFVSGVSITVTNSSTGTYLVTASAVPSTTRITANVTIGSVPTDSYVTVTISPPTGSSVSKIVGVAHAYKTISDIQTIFNNNQCLTCHTNAGAGELNFSNTTTTINTLSSIDSKYCSAPKLRVSAGDPRRTSNVLIDVLKAKTPMTDVTCQMPRGGNPPLSSTDIDAIVDWIALGTN